MGSLRRAFRVRKKGVGLVLEFEVFTFGWSWNAFSATLRCFALRSAGSRAALGFSECLVSEFGV